MQFKLNVITGLFIIVPAFAGWIRLRHIRPDFYPFIIILGLGFCNELLSLVMIYKTGSNVINYNNYVLLKGLLITWQFSRWQSSPRFNFACITLAVLLPVVWVFDWVFQQTITNYFSYYILTRNSILAFLSICFISRRLLVVTYRIYRDPIFLICSGWLISFVYGLITELLLLQGIQLKTHFLYYLVSIFSTINLVVLLIHLYAVLCIPPKIR